MNNESPCYSFISPWHRLPNHVYRCLMMSPRYSDLQSIIMVEYFFTCFLPAVCLLWWGVSVSFAHVWLELLFPYCWVFRVWWSGWHVVQWVNKAPACNTGFLIWMLVCVLAVPALTKLPANMPGESCRRRPSWAPAGGRPGGNSWLWVVEVVWWMNSITLPFE